MKLKQWLKEYKKMSYAEYKALPEYERYSIQGEHQSFCRKEQRHAGQNWRPATEQEKAELESAVAKEKERYRASLEIGGIDERGNYTALHHR